MPGPGGGGNAGGFGGGRGAGGGRGGWGGRPPRGPRRFGFFGPRFFGGGCLGGLLSLFLAPFILILLAVILFFAFFGAGFSSLAQGGVVTYSESKLQDYADEQYAAEFGGSTAYEDNLLLVFLTNEDADYYYSIAWVGDHVQPQINSLFGNENTAFGRAVLDNIPDYYAYSLDTNLASIVNTMADEVSALGLASSFTCGEDHIQVDSHLSNYTDLSLTAATVDGALAAFTETTGISVVIVVEDMEEVFGEYLSPFAIVFIVLLVVIAVVLIVVGVRRYKKRKNDGGSFGGNGQDDGPGGVAKCPYCGASFEYRGRTAVCPYCGNAVDTGK